VNSAVLAREHVIAARDAVVVDPRSFARVTPEQRSQLARDVDRGAALLDELYGRDAWLSRVDLATLDVSSPFDCVVAQVTDEIYSHGVYQIRFKATILGKLDETFTCAHGFEARYGNWHIYRALTELWRDKVRALRAERVEVTA
jgi:hypothetical protein